LGPTTATVFNVLARGRTPSFFRSTIDARAASRASRRCASVSFAAAGMAAHFTDEGGSKSPSRKREASTRVSARSRSCSLT